jgi:hypothetical protein
MGDLREDLVEHQPGHQQRQAKVQALAADVEDQWFPAVELLPQFGEVRRQADAGEGEAKQPVAQFTTPVQQALFQQGQRSGFRKTRGWRR